MTWATGNPLDALMQKSDSTNEYDNFFVLLDALYASKKFSYKIAPSGKTYPAVQLEETSHDVNAKSLGESITKEELEKYGVWKK
ncbi:hypothetical protein [Leclercia sp.]|uniref:hypothetical protein n=1 Tax=Leclercia sp. TaxID=1898428 RepID=UPI002896A85E|nr:hypothetical protein [Leclercia sp.]